MTHVSDYGLHDYGQRITYIGGEVSFDKMGAAEYEFGAIERALTAFGLMSRDMDMALSKVTLDFTPLIKTHLYETPPLTETWTCFHSVNSPPPDPIEWLRAKSAPMLISTVAILPLGRLGPMTREVLDKQPKLLYIRNSVVGAIRQAVKIHVFDRAHTLGEEFIASQDTNSG